MPPMKEILEEPEDLEAGSQKEDLNVFQEKIVLQQKFEIEKIKRARKFKAGENVLEQQKK